MFQQTRSLANPTTSTFAQGNALPKATSWPLVGGLPFLLRDGFGYLQQMQQTHGDIFHLPLGIQDLILCSHPDHAQYILRDNARNFSKGGELWASVRELFGNGLATSEGDFWLRQRRMMQPHFHRRYLAQLFELMATSVDEQLAKWPLTAAEFDLSSAINEMTMDIIVRTMFGTQLAAREFAEVSEAIRYALDFMLPGMLAESLPGWVPFPGQARFYQARECFDRIVYDVIKRCRTNGDSEGLLGMLLNVVDAETGEQMSDEQLRDEVATIFVAGYETTALALAWAVDFLARDPELQHKLAVEIEQAVGDAKPELASLRQLDLVQRTFKEALRIRPSAWFLPRMAVEDDCIDGFQIPAGSQLLIMIKHLHHHPEHWVEPGRFDPDRFLEKTPGGHPNAFMPFGAGQRQCIGRDFAYMEGQLILTRLLQKYRVSPVSDQVPLPGLSSTLRPKDGIKVGLFAV